MTKLRVFWVIVTLCLAAAPAPALVVAERPAPVSQDDLDQLIAPVALYPDPLLAHVLAAATYPVEVGEAVRFMEEHDGLRGQELAMEIRNKGWEPTVSALLQFPAVLAMMGAHADWVRRLGDVFLREQPAVIETVQTLRGLALDQGSLRSSLQQNIYVAGDLITILPANPRDICVPVYDPSTIYGAWWLPEKPPLIWRPRQRGPRVHDMLSAGISFAPCNTLAAASYASASPDWETRQLRMTRRGVTETWQHDPGHRRGAPYPTAAVRARFESEGPGRDSGIRRGPRGASGVTIIRPKVDPQPEAER
ncbi:DUF3300 domain-containing protein [Emcibacter sp. SYSU 3D8]|uniref:DUF3300 domain-containing protein n=1 Tax=Emcibacter sp. SYSU 3D8 TaxID=3133969 RepID=UPI0031FF3F04